MSEENTPSVLFEDLALSAPVMEALKKVGYESPSPIQAATIPYLLEGKDLVGQAQTGTGKTAAFALPILTNIDLSQRLPQALVLAPTRELAIQVAEAFQTYASHLKGFNVLPIYGGQGYDTQLRQLRRGVHVVVGTPGRVMDHMRKGTLKLDNLQTLVLDEADEMLRMGFIDDVEWVLEQTPDTRQVVLFSATMPSVIRRIAKNHLSNPEEVTIKLKTATASTIRQRFCAVKGPQKLDALTRILEAEPFDGMLIFVRTKNETVILSEKLEARGYSAAALNGDIAQNLRERTVDRLKKGKLDILVATDVVARGLDVERISHVINYDIPYDTEAYVHRIGRTGRAGRQGDAILFVAPREKRMLATIERATRQKIEPMKMPSTADINVQRVEKFKQRITDVLEGQDLSQFSQLLDDYRKDNDVPPLKIAAAMAFLSQGDQPLLLSEMPEPPARERRDRREGRDDFEPRERKARNKTVQAKATEAGMQRFRISVGHAHGVKPANIVGAIANEAELDRKNIGQIEIYDDFSTVDLPQGMPKELLQLLKRVRVCHQQMNIAVMEEGFKGGRRKPSGGSKKRAENNPNRGPNTKPKTFKKKQDRDGS